MSTTGAVSTAADQVFAPFAISDLSGTWTFREIADPGTLLAAFRFRYEVYRSSRLAGLCPENAERMDVDCWDTSARHFGLFSGDEIVGYVRTVQPGEATATGLLRILSKQNANIARAIAGEAPAPLPVLHEYPDRAIVSSHYPRWLADGEHVVQVSRFCLHPRWRRLTTARTLAESILATGFFGRWQVDRALFTCDARHGAFHRGLGFASVPGTGRIYWPEINSTACVLMATPEQLSPSQISSFCSTADRLDCTREITQEAFETIRRLR